MSGGISVAFILLFFTGIAFADNSRIIPPEQLRRIEEFKERLKGIRERTLEKAKKRGFTAEKEKNGTKNIPFLYIFISSSVPMEVWWNYARYMSERNIKGAFILRGCIGGCRYIKPTLEFIRRFLTEDGRNETGFPVEVWIDPLKFREYGVKRVPCVAKEGSKEISCGDWNMEYHLRKLGSDPW